MCVRSTTEMAVYNPNYVGGDILTGVERPAPVGIRAAYHARSRTASGIPGNYICSAATPPGPGAHGMCGMNAAETALREWAKQR